MIAGNDIATHRARTIYHSAIVWALVFGAFLTLRGYHSFDGDQAYRLPILLHQQNPTLFASDPFVRAFDTFNPHRGYLTLVDAASRPLGLAVGIATLFALTCGKMAVGVSRLSRLVWPEAGARVGWVAVGLILVAKAGNIGTNHLFEATLLDRLVGFALGWVALAGAVSGNRRGRLVSAAAIGAATLVHPSVGLQLGLTLLAGWIAWAAWPGTQIRVRESCEAVGLLAMSLLPGLALMAGQGGTLFRGLPPDEFRDLAVLIQGPQHMVPHLWRLPQWLAWGCYPALAVLALGRVGLVSNREPGPSTRVRLACLLVINVLSLILAYLAVEVVGDLRVTLFQPFRMATLTRGLALVAVAGRLLALVEQAGWLGRLRVAVLVAGLSGDRVLVVATVLELSLTGVDLLRRDARVGWTVALLVLGVGCTHLGRHDTESGHLPILGAMIVVALAAGASRVGLRPVWDRRRVVFLLGAAWAVPALAIGVGVLDPKGVGWVAELVARCRFAEVPTDDLERLAVWVRDHTPTSARFIGPPGPKTFRLWSRRAVAFNRAGSPYHAEGLADWADRFRDHVGFDGSTAAFARAYLADRHRLESHYGTLTGSELGALAVRQGATHVLVEQRQPPREDRWPSPLIPLHRIGRFAVYQVDPVWVAQRVEAAGAVASGSAIRTDSTPAFRTATTTAATVRND